LILSQHNDSGDQVIVALRRVIRAVDLHSRALVESHDLTGPQALVLRALQNGSLSAGTLATQVGLSHVTVTDSLNRLEKCGLISAAYCGADHEGYPVEPDHHGMPVPDRI
jgi:hypothetical protein